ncbi:MULTISPECIES: DUF6458 family protein [unclassified Serinicoccus]|jgi:hypothetical protein|uniref:DUF6458 family protein n=1 Tax=unclassified Serinicoccus TaxID=2643101 RepID=UPI003851E5F5
MGIGLGIFLLVVGAILSFAVQDAIDGVNLITVGYILMAAGVLSLLLGLVLNTQRTNTTHREIVDRHNDTDVRHRGGPEGY